MYVNGKKMAFTGLLLAITEVLLILSGILEFNTLFLLGAASFGVGIVIREFGLGFGGAFYAASVLLSFLLAPNKFYCITYGAMGLYLLGEESIYRRIGKLKMVRYRKPLFWAAKYVLFNLMYLPMLFFFPKLLFAGELSRTFILAAFFLGQAVLFVYDRAYEYFQSVLWNRIRRRLLS